MLGLQSRAGSGRPIPARPARRSSDALDNARAAVEELRELAAGIHPAVLTQRGLDAAIESLATRAAVPVEYDGALDERLPAAVESAGYFFVAEALVNVAKHARATHAAVAVRREDGELVLEVSDDGAGGADPRAAAACAASRTALGALDGRLEVDSPPGGGTRLSARVPIGSGA